MIKEDVGKDKLPLKVVNLANLVSYQKDAIVSHTVIDNDAGSTTIFAFDKGQGLNEHKVPYDALIYILEGEASVTISDRLFRLEEEQMVTLPGNTPHSVRAPNRFKMLLVLIRS